jgi:hypothetical protein
MTNRPIGRPRSFDESKTRRLRYIRHEQDQGISRTRNTAIAHGRGEGRVFLNHENEWAPHYLERQLALAATHPAADVAYCWPRQPDPRIGNSAVRARVLVQGGGGSSATRARLAPADGAVMIRQSALVKIGRLDERLGASEGVDLWLPPTRRSEFAETADLLVIRHDYHGGQQRSLDFALRGRDLAVLDANRARCEVEERDHGCLRAGGYRRWRKALELGGAVRAASAGQRVQALRSAWAMARFLPSSAPHLAAVLGATLRDQRADDQLVDVRLALRRVHRFRRSPRRMSRGPPVLRRACTAVRSST